MNRLYQKGVKHGFQYRNTARMLILQREHPQRIPNSSPIAHCWLSSGRVPLPPMPRVMPRATVHNNMTFAARVREWWDNGNILLFIGWSGVALMVLDQYLQYQMLQPDKEEMMEEIVYSAQLQRQRLYEEYKDHPALFRCRVMNADARMGGSHGLRHVQLGDVVEILVPGVGPDGAYHMCRLRRPDAPDELGWFPIKNLQVVKPWWKRLFL